MKCIDVIGSTGIAGLLWKKYLGDAVNVYINDPHEKCFEIVTANRNENNLNVEVMKRDPCVLLQEIPFSFMYVTVRVFRAIHFFHIHFFFPFFKFLSLLFSLSQNSYSCCKVAMQDPPFQLLGMETVMVAKIMFTFIYKFSSIYSY